MHVSALLHLLRQVGEKALRIASIIRSEKALVDLLVQEKPEIEKNEQSYQDFKTLADVLIQETVRDYIGKEIPSLRDSIYGEESNIFTNAKGESIVIEICNTQEETQSMLARVLSGEPEAVRLLAEAVHSEPAQLKKELSNCDLVIPVEDCGIWIDPIDSTSQYIKGHLGQENEHGVVVEGLQCVAILIGLFHKTSGKPIMGLALQPFHCYDKHSKRWTSNTVWGVCYCGEKHTSLTAEELSQPQHPKVIMSHSESEAMKGCLRQNYEVMIAAGAGYKLLSTIMGLSTAYVLSHQSIYRWDCCAVHAILRALGGGIVSYKHAVRGMPRTKEDLDELQVSYIKASGAIRSRKNSITDGTESLPGIIAYRKSKDVLDILELLKKGL